MGKVGNLTGFADVGEADLSPQGRDRRSLRVVVVGIVVLAIALVAVAISGAASPTDASVKNFQQCANNAPPSTATDCPGGWINGILQSNNSHYAEDDVTAQRAILTLPKDGPLTGRTIEITYQTRKGGVHAYDSLATWNHTQTSADRCSDLNPADCVGGSASTFAIPADPTVVADNNGSGSATSGHQLAGQVMTMYGGTITGVSVPTHTAGSGDQDASLVVTYSVADLTSAGKIMLLFGGHIAPSLGPRGWGVGVGAGSISGGPYHISICQVDGDSSGCRDNQIMSGAILAPANLLIEKVAVGGDDTFNYTSAGGLSPASFPIATSGGSGSQSFTNITPGTYTVTESAPPAGWDFTSLDCVDEDGNSSETGATGTIVLAAGETATCTYTNTKRGNIIVAKQTNPDGDPAVFDFTATYGNFSLTDGQQNDSGLLVPGTYSVSETVPAGWDMQSSCSDGSSASSIALAAGETVTCTFTNTKRGSIIVDKVTAPAGDPQSFPFTLTGGPDQLNQPFSLTDAATPHDSGLVKPGTYVASETSVPAGWDLTGSTCSDGSPVGAIDLAAGETVTCTFTNTKRTNLIVIKHVINDNGGTAVAGDFQMTVDDPGTNPPSFPGAESPGTSVVVDPGAYSVSESGPAGYQMSLSTDCSGVLALGETKTCTVTNDDQAASLTVVKELVNDNGGTKGFADFSFDVAGPTASSNTFFDLDGSVTLGVSAGSYTVTEDQANLDGYTTTYANCTDVAIPLGGTATCTIRNDDNAPSLTLVKEVVNDDGGTAQASEWTLTAAGPTGLSGSTPVVSGASFDAGSYDLSESGPAGYDASDWVCTAGQADADTVEVGLGESITCTITNNDQPASLTVIKHVVNDNGGSAVAADFPITVTGANPNPASFPGAEAGTAVAIEPGAYNVTEVESPDYAASYSAECSGSIALGESRTCTITNDDIAPSLTLVKEVVNDNGGTALPTAWTLTADGPTGFSGLGPSVSSGADFAQGTYNLSEAGPAGYDASGWDCNSESQSDADTVTVGLGDEITCTIVNDDLAAALIVRKVVVNDNGGTRVASDFSFRVNGGTAQPFEADGQNDLVVDAGSYNVTEPAIAGYTTSYANCSNLVIPNGGSATCTVTNNDVAPGVGSITVSKSANPTTLQEPGGLVTFSVTITNTSLDVMVAIENVVDDKFGDLDDDGGNGCFDVPVNLAPGQSVNCSFQRQITGVGGTAHVNTVTVTGHDPAGNTLRASDDARVDITPRLIDLVIVKEASSPTPLNGIVNYSLTVTNRGPDTATNVQVADPAPAGIVYLSASPSQGSCSLASALVTCSLGTIAPGQTVTIAITARATTVGSHTNTATVTGAGGRETNPADNVDSAVTIVPTPLKPPVVKPAQSFCLALTVSPQMIRADGKPDRVSVRVTAGKKRMRGVTVVVSGAGVKKSAVSNGKGVATLRINPRKAGIVTITAQEPNQKVCGAKRIGVVGVFLPPLTG